jgi:hypothetical protein
MTKIKFFLYWFAVFIVAILLALSAWYYIGNMLSVSNYKEIEGNFMKISFYSNIPPVFGVMIFITIMSFEIICSRMEKSLFWFFMNSTIIPLPICIFILRDFGGTAENLFVPVIMSLAIIYCIELIIHFLNIIFALIPGFNDFLMEKDVKTEIIKFLVWSGVAFMIAIPYCYYVDNVLSVSNYIGHFKEISFYSYISAVLSVMVFSIIMFVELTFLEVKKEFKGILTIFIALAMIFIIYLYFFISRDFEYTTETAILFITILITSGFFARLMVNFLIIIHSKILLGKVLKWFVRDLFSGIVGRSFDYITVKTKAIRSCIVNFVKEYAR